jgi:hypothetical protein
MRSLVRLIPLLALPGLACADDPVYLNPTPAAIEVNGPSAPPTATASLVVPVRLETEAERMRREALAAELMLTPDQVPTVRRDELELEVEWTIKNLDAQPGNAVLTAVAANEWFAYDPTAFIVDPEEDEAPPPLLGGIPLELPASGTVSGVWREDELAEAAQDLDAFTRHGITPERAILDQWDSGDIVDDAGALLMPSEAVPSLLQIDVAFAADTHMVLEYVVRVRDHSGRLAPYEDETWMLVQPAANGAYVPPPPPMP